MSHWVAVYEICVAFGCIATLFVTLKIIYTPKNNFYYDIS